MRKLTYVFLLAAPAGLFVVEPAVSKHLGILPFDVVFGFGVGPLTRTSTQACGQCHARPSTNAAPGAVTVSVTPTSRVLSAGASTTVQISSSSSVPSGSGGFTSDVTAGFFVAGAGTRTSATGNAITHSINTSRAWTVTYKAASTPGLAEMYVVSLNGNSNVPVLRADVGDRYAFHGSSPANTTSTPVRLYANAVGFKAVGDSCSDGFGNHSVLGGKNVPAIGTTFTLESFGLPPSAPLLFMMSLGTNLPPLDLAIMGAPGCILRQNMDIQIRLATSAGDASRAEGAFVLPIPVPNNPGLRGLGFTVQLGVIDSNSKRNFPFNVTNGLEVTLQ